MTTVPDVPQSHDDAARELLLGVRSLRESVPGLVLLPKERLMELINAATVPDEFLEAVLIGSEATSDLAAVSKLDRAEVRDVIAFSRAYGGAMDETELLHRMVKHTIILRRAKVGQEALRVFALAKGLNRPRKSGLLVPHIEAMRRALGRSRAKPVTETPPEAA